MAKKFVSYLENLKFNEKWRSTWHAHYITNFRLVTLLILAIVVFGIFSYIQLPRRLNPELKIAIVNVSTFLPGASPNDMESLVTVPLEDKLQGVKGLDTITSSSLENVSAITMQFTSGVDPDKARTDVQSLVDTVDLPEDAQTPTVQAIDFEDVPVWTFAVVSKSDTASLMRFSKILKDRIGDVAKVGRVVTSGFEEQEVQVLLDPIKLREYSVNPITLSQTVSKAASSYPAGNVNTGSFTFPLTIDQDIQSINDIRNLRIMNESQIVKLGDIATITERSKNDQNLTYYLDHKRPKTRAVQFFVYKTSSSNIDAAEKDVRIVVEHTMEEYKGKFELVTISNTADDIGKQFTDLLSEFRSTIILVFINLLLFLGLRQAIISSLTVPLTFLSTFVIINALGMSINFLTLFAFLIALGLLIDDTIVTVAAMTRYYATGKFTPQETGIVVWRDFIVPLWSTTITTIWAFVPLLLSTGIIGEFIKPIPIVVTATLLSSTAIAVLITLPLMIVALKPQIPHRVALFLKIIASVLLIGVVIALIPKSPLLPLVIVVFLVFMFVTYRLRTALMISMQSRLKNQKRLKTIATKASHIVNHGVINTEALSHRYMTIVDRILSSRSARIKTLAILVIFALVSYLLVPLGLVKNEFFPKTDSNLLYVGVELPAGSNLQTTSNEMLILMDQLQNTPETEFIIAETGTGGLNDFGGRTSSGNLFLFTLHLTDMDKRSITSIDIAEQLRKKFASYSKGTLTVQEQSGGPPAGADLQIKLSGDNLNTLDSYADRISTYLKKQRGVSNVSKSIRTSTSKLSFVPDKSKIAEAGLSIDAIGLWLRTYASGFTLDTVKFGKDDTDVVLKVTNTNSRPEELGGLTITTPQGTSIPLLSLGSFQIQSNPTSITREGGKRTISVSATVTKGYVVADKNKELEAYADSLNLPSGYDWKTGGVNEENEKSVQSIFQAMALSFLLIFATMVIEFKSFRQAIMILLLIPLAIPGVFYIFALTGTPLSFPALIGILALFGLVVTNGIVVIEKINDNRHSGMNVHDSIVDASGSRLEPILLTSITSILGLIPITIADPLWRGLGGAIISGLLFSGAIKLFFIPVLYYIWYKDEDKKKKKN